MALSMACLAWRRRREKYSEKSEYSKGEAYHISTFSEDSRSNTSTVATLLSSHIMVCYPDNFMIDKKLEFPRSDLILEETLGEGEFGCVVSAKAYNLHGTPGPTKV